MRSNNMKYVTPIGSLALYGLLVLFALASCSSSDNTVVINDAPVTSAQPDTNQAPQPNEPGQPFQQLTIGENQPIRSLDPLFAQNASEFRAIQQIYEGLVRYNQNGDIVPGVARKWSQSDDYKTYRFTLQHDLFYQDSDVFSNGRGRRVVAQDIKADFKRMAQANVPAAPARFFMNIKGFEPYFREQHQLMRSSDRQLKGISGITTPSDSTVVFSLAQPDEHFLQRLAMPYAVVYPPESAKGDRFQAVGTGPFKLSQKRTDSLYILARFQGYHVTNQPNIDRLDIITSRNETALLNRLNAGDIQLLPQLGPRQMQMALGSDGQLSPELSGRYNVTTAGAVHTYFLRYYDGADLSKERVKGALGSARSDNYFTGLPDGALSLRWATASSSTSSVDSLSSTYSNDPFVGRLYDQLARHLSQEGTHFSMSQSRIPDRNTSLYIDKTVPFQQTKMATTPENTLLSLEIKSRGIARKDIEDLRFNSFYWWIDLREATVPSTNQ